MTSSDSKLFILVEKEITETVVYIDGTTGQRTRIVAEPVPVRIERRGNDTLILLDEQ